MNKFAHRDVVIETTNPNKKYVVLGPNYKSLNDQELLLFDNDSGELVIFNEKKLKKVEAFTDLEVYFCPPIFENLELLDNIQVKLNGLQGTIIAVNPIIVPLNNSCKYLVQLKDGSFGEYDRNEIELQK